MTDQTTALSKAAVKAFYDSASRGDIDGCIATLHEDFEAAIPTCLPWTGVHKGPAAFRADVLPRLRGRVRTGAE
jgi:ketosteroid isomerase-like protein